MTMKASLTKLTLIDVFVTVVGYHVSAFTFLEAVLEKTFISIYLPSNL